jgi:hypothetical protein
MIATFFHLVPLVQALNFGLAAMIAANPAGVQGNLLTSEPICLERVTRLGKDSPTVIAAVSATL